MNRGMCDLCGVAWEECQCARWTAAAVLRDLKSQTAPSHLQTEAEREAFLDGLDYGISMTRLILPKEKR